MNEPSLRSRLDLIQFVVVVVVIWIFGFYIGRSTTTMPDTPDPMSITLHVETPQQVGPLLEATAKQLPALMKPRRR